MDANDKPMPLSIGKMSEHKTIHAGLCTCNHLAALGAITFALSRILAFCSDPFHGSSLYGRKIFERIENPTICMCNTMIKAFLLEDQNFEAVEVYRVILRCGMRPDDYTFPYLLKACGNMRNLNLGGLMHGHVISLGLLFNNFVCNTLMAMYSALDDMEAAKCVFDEISCHCVVSWTVLISGYCKKGDVYSARLIFDEARVKDIGIWGAMISGYVQNNCFKEGLKLFRLMQIHGVGPDEAVLVSILCACAHLGCLEIGLWVHRYVEKQNKLLISVKLGTAFIDMYARSGRLSLAWNVFDNMTERDLICWNTMISGYAMNGDGESALKLFDEMWKSGVRPDEVTFISLFTACSYSDMAQKGLNLLDIMCNVYNIEPKSEHYGCIVDFLCRSGHIEEAYGIVQRVPVSDSATEQAIAWRAFLSACCSHRHVDLATAAAERLVKLERHSGAYVLLSNVYSAAGRHVEARRIRTMMKRQGVEKTPGCSSVEINGIVHEFVAGEWAHSKMDGVHNILQVIKGEFNFLHCNPSAIHVQYDFT
ncbi:pentatricopeptide repeat-containing protein-like [Dorcoceras hygrometricum]|uniref:Pentatricopeptide repeat-containing protein-like n=1 Tax=Dorcoceras hygrometricum TaxID=472368 RepID=A0A2Z7DC29_9LAMI|nr:pentatricopeptide repeat-containing protein-like [Dorcoceras hygrometricum]